MSDGPLLKRQKREDGPPAGYVAGAGRGARPIMGVRTDSAPSADEKFGQAPPGYIPGKGRGATGFVGGVSRDEADRDDDKTDIGDGAYDDFAGSFAGLFGGSVYDDDDKEADMLYDQIEVRMNERRGKWVEASMK